MSEELRRRVIDVAVRRLRRKRDSRWAWQQLYNCLWPFITSIARTITDDAEDASQEVFIRLAKYAPFEKFTRPEMFQSYVAAITMNVARDQYRRSVRRDVHEEPLTDAIAQRATDPGWSPEQEAEVSNLATWILERLTADERHMMRGMFDGYSLQVLASQYDTKYSTVGVRMFRLRRKVRMLLGGQPKKTRSS
jgi:RNA polymerase sigma factor (sigma-70 family)